MLERLRRTIRPLWKRLFSSSRYRKTFDIQGEQITHNPLPVFPLRRLGKKFAIEGEDSIQRAVQTRLERSNRNSSTRSRSERNSHFKPHAETRPKVCPLCRTADKITRLESGRWQCNVCGHKWR